MKHYIFPPGDYGSKALHANEIRRGYLTRSPETQSVVFSVCQAQYARSQIFGV